MKRLADYEIFVIFLEESFKERYIKYILACYFGRYFVSLLFSSFLHVCISSCISFLLNSLFTRNLE